MNRKTKAILLLAILTLSFTAVLPVTAHTEDEPYVTDLMAGQHMDAGDVLVWNDGEYLYVKYVADEGWMISETHLHVAIALEEIPQKNGNPIPGKFDYKNEHDPWVTEYTYQIELTWDIDDELYIAAHAVVKDLVNTDEYCIDFEDEMYNEFDPVMMVSTDFGPVNFYMTDWDEIDGITVGDTAELESTGEYPIIAEPQNYDVEAPAYNIAGFTVNIGGLVDDYVKADPDNTGAGGKTLTDPLDETQSELLKHAYSRHQAIVVDLSEIEGMLSLSLAGIDPDHGETWYAYYFDADNELIHINTYQGNTQAKDGYAIPLTYDDMNIAKIAFYGLNNLAIEGRVGYAIDNICLETAGEETAWGAPHDFPGKNWALYLKYTVQGEIPVIWPGEAGTMTVAFEDLPLGGSLDWDYNDFVVDVDTLATYFGTTEDNGLQKMDFTVLPEARGAGYDHEFHLMIPANTFLSNGEYILTIYDENGDPLAGYPATGSFDATADNDYTVIPSTTTALPGTLTNTIEPTGIVSHYPTKTNTDPNAPQHQPYVPTKRTATLTITFDALEDFDFTAYDPYSGYHGEGLFFDPYLHVLDTGNKIHTGDARMLTVPVDWMWPEAGIEIWLAYPDVTSGTPPTFAPDWWLNTNDLVYDGKP